MLELRTADAGLRPLHGQVIAAECVGSNGGLARYVLRIEPWLSLLRQRVDSYVFHDRSVVEIVEDVFADYAGESVAPAWRWGVADPSVYRKRSVTAQYAESDFDFIARLLAEEGIAYRFEHAADADGDSLGSHTLVLFDHAHGYADLAGPPGRGDRQHL